MLPLSREQLREVDRRASELYGVASICLMENAGAGAARIALEMLGDSRLGTVECLCGRGNNGGDGFVAARHLLLAGVAVEIALLGPGDEPSGALDAAANLAACRALGIPVAVVDDETGARALEARLGGSALVLDGLFGTGLTRPLTGVAAELVLVLDRSRARVLALDVPSGLDCDRGEPLGPCVRADVTATFAAMKLGFENPASRGWTGEVRLVGIGAPADLRGR